MTTFVRSTTVLLILALASPAQARDQVKDRTTQAVSLQAKGFARTLRLRTSVNDRHGAATTDKLVSSLRAHPVGRKLVESMGGEVRNLTFISRGQFKTVQKWFRARGLPTPPAGEAGYNLPVGDQVVTAILPEFRGDTETALRELTYQQLLTPFFRDGTIVNAEITRAVHREFDRRFPGASAERRQQWMELFVRLLGNLRAGEVMSLSGEHAPEVRNQRYDAFRSPVSQAKLSPTGKIQKLLATPFTLKGYEQWPYADQVYYGQTMFGVQPMTKVDAGEASRRATAVKLSPELDRLLHPVLDRTDPKFWSVF